MRQPTTVLSVRRWGESRQVGVLLAVVLLGAVLAGVPGSTAAAEPASGPPPLTVPVATLEAALHCPLTFPDAREPVLLVHGTFTNDAENYDWNYRTDLDGRGFDVCTVTLPNRSLDDIQVASEYVVHAIRRIAAASGDQVDVIGHSQGGLEPRWAIKWWSDIPPLVDDLVMLATPNHGTLLGPFGGVLCAACFQMGPSSDLLNALNAGDETPGAVSYTSIWSDYDEIVLPPDSARLDGAANISLQDVCWLRPGGHVSVVADAVVHGLVLDALTGPGPADVGRASFSCLSTNFVSGAEVVAGLALLVDTLADPQVPAVSIVDDEPALAWYADPAATPAATVSWSGIPVAVEPDDVVSATLQVRNTGNVALTGVTVDVPGPVDCGDVVIGALAVAAQAEVSCSVEVAGSLELFAKSAAMPLEATVSADQIVPVPAPPTILDVVLPDAAWPDVAPWFRQAAGWLSYWDLAAGYPDGNFVGSADISRAQLVRMLYRLAGRPDVDALPPSPFPDTPAWVADAVRWAAHDVDGSGPAQPLITGQGGRFAPDRPVTRAETVRMVYRFADRPAVAGLPLANFPDVPQWVATAVRWAAADLDGAGPLEAVITGRADGTFAPDDPVSRAELARILYRACLALASGSG